MGVDAGDYDNDGDYDLYVTHFFRETNTLYRNEGGGRFADATVVSGLAAPTVSLLGWGTRFFDYDNDGLLDLFISFVLLKHFVTIIFPSGLAVIIEVFLKDFLFIVSALVFFSRDSRREATRSTAPWRWSRSRPTSSCSRTTSIT